MGMGLSYQSMKSPSVFVCDTQLVFDVYYAETCGHFISLSQGELCYMYIEYCLHMPRTYTARILPTYTAHTPHVHAHTMHTVHTPHIPCMYTAHTPHIHCTYFPHTRV